MLAGVGSEISDWPFAAKSRTESAAGPMVTDRAKNGDPELGFGPLARALLVLGRPKLRAGERAPSTTANSYFLLCLFL